MSDFIIEDGILRKYDGKDEVVTVPSGVVEIGQNAFSGSSVRKVVFPEGVKRIDQYAFSGSFELRSVVFPNTLETIENYAFYACHNLAINHLQIGDTVKIGEYAFRDCCRERYSEHSFVVHYHIGKQAKTENVLIGFFDEQTLQDVMEDALAELIDSAFDETLQDSLNQRGASMNEEGTYNIIEEGTNIYGAAKEYLSLLGDSIGLYLVDDYTDPSAPRTISVDVVASLQKKIDDRMICESWDSDLSYAINADLMNFAEISRWQFGLASSENIISDVCEWPAPKKEDSHIVWATNDEVLIPTIWFGPIGSKPLPHWSITEETKSAELSFWFLEDSEEILYNVVTDCYNSFIIWYLAECGLDTPELSEIIKDCPVQFYENDSDNEIKEKVSSFFLEYYLAHTSVK